MAEKESKLGIIILTVLGLAAAFGGVYSIINMMNPQDKEEDKTSIESSASMQAKTQVEDLEEEYIAVVSVKGVIEEKNETYDQDWLTGTIEVLKEDEKNKAVLLAINSPGGGLYEADEVYYALQKYKESGKPVWAYLGQTAASGGYYIACAADQIFAHKTTLTGSIGVLLGPSIDISELLEKYGIKTTTFTSGANKNMLSFDNPVTDEQRQIMQSIVDDAYEQFVEVVVNGRSLPESQVRILADGRIYTARQALENNLIDDILYFDQTLAALQDALLAEIAEKNTVDNMETSEKDTKTSDTEEVDGEEDIDDEVETEEKSEYAVEYFEPRRNSDSFYELLDDLSFFLKSPAVTNESMQLLEKITNETAASNYRLQL